MLFEELHGHMGQTVKVVPVCGVAWQTKLVGIKSGMALLESAALLRPVNAALLQLKS